MYLAEKMGYCYEKMLDYSRAYSYYCKAELLGASSKWLWKHLLIVLADNDPTLALQYAERLYESDPNSLKARLDYINALKNTNKEEELLKVLYQCYYENPEISATTLLLARTLLNRNETDKAKGILNSFSFGDDEPDSAKKEYNALKGIVAIFDGDIAESISYFKAIGEHQTSIELHKIQHTGLDEMTCRLILELVRIR